MVLENESLHVGRMVADETLKGFISTSKAVTVPKGFAGDDGFVYVLKIDGGYHVPDKGAHGWTTIFGEQEIAFPGSVSWNDVMGFRAMGSGGLFRGALYLRRSFAGNESKAAKEVFRLLSGKKQ